jgi:transposase
MAARRADVLNVYEVIRRIREKEKDRRMARDLKMSRKTVKFYREAAGACGWLLGPMPDRAEIGPGVERYAVGLRVAPSAVQACPVSSVEPYREFVKDLREGGVEIQAIFERLKEVHQFKGSYSSVRRFVRSFEPLAPEAYVRIETPPGEESQVDFGFAGKMKDPVMGKLRKAWCFVMTLSFSRHQYVEFVFDQEVSTFIGCHVHAFESFGGVVKRVVLDNLKSGVLTSRLEDQTLNQVYRDCAAYYGFLASPCKPRTARHKGKVENGVHYVKRNFLAGRAFRDMVEANEKALVWIYETAGKRVHGTTKRLPLEQFDRYEKAALRPLPARRFEVPQYKMAKLHPDCSVVFNGSYYTAPCRLIGQELLVKASGPKVEIYHKHAPVAVHRRAMFPGERVVNKDHYPPEKVQYLMQTPLWCREQAARIGSHTAQVVETMLSLAPLDHLRQVQAVLRLERTVGRDRLEKACRRAAALEAFAYGKIKRILEKGLENEPLPAWETSTALPAQPALFARTADEFFSTSRVVDPGGRA